MRIFGLCAVAVGLSLAALLLFGVNRARACGGPHKVVRAEMNVMKVALEQYHADQRRYPRTEGAHLFGDDAAGLYTALRRTKQDGGGINGPYLTSQRRVGRLPLEFTDPGAMGEDGNSGVQPLEGDADAVLLDPWGNPYHYREWGSINRDVKAELVRRPEIRLGFRGPDGIVRSGLPPIQHPVGDKPHDTEAYDIWSNGPNGVNEYGAPCSDDITSWTPDRYHFCTCDFVRSTRGRGGSSMATTLAAGGLILLVPTGLVGGVAWRRRRRRRRLIRGISARIEIAPVVPSFPISIRPRTCALRCVYCHAPAEDALPVAARCPSCQALLHGDCWSLARRCPTLGCRGRPKRPRRRGRLNRLRRFSSLWRR